jgi:hypothetical protein
MKELLEKAEIEIKKEMEEVGFIDDSDRNCGGERFLDELAKKLTREELRITDDEDEDEAKYEMYDELLNTIGHELVLICDRNYKVLNFFYNGEAIIFYYKDGSPEELIEVLSLELEISRDEDYKDYIRYFLEEKFGIVEDKEEDDDDYEDYEEDEEDEVEEEEDE